MRERTKNHISRPEPQVQMPSKPLVNTQQRPDLLKGTMDLKHIYILPQRTTPPAHQETRLDKGWGIEIDK
eukprot:4373062-Prorocentrum_lima.AAC.1